MAVDLDALVRDIPDFPKPGIVFKDITPVLADAKLFREVIDAFVARWKDERISKVIGIESRGFLFAAPLAYALGAGLTIVRKPGKLPWTTISEAYALEYGEATLELHIDAVGPGDRVLVVDDVLATGGTLEAAIALVEELGGVVTAVSVVIELAALGGRQRIAPHSVHALWTA
jgi:adenine phosphoribosyltransferase